jgi:hypothetical protein
MGEVAPCIMSQGGNADMTASDSWSGRKRDRQKVIWIRRNPLKSLDSDE